MMQHLISLPLASAAVLALSAISASGPEVGVVVGVPPPPPKVEMGPVLPVPGYAWRPGYWRWEVDRYIWIPGGYLVTPQPHAVWVSGRWAPANGGWIWMAGYWRY